MSKPHRSIEREFHVLTVHDLLAAGFRSADAVRTARALWRAGLDWRDDPDFNRSPHPLTRH